MHHRYLLTSLFMAAALAACVGEGSTGKPEAVMSVSGLSFAAKLNSGVSEPSEALVLWGVTSGTPDYAYLWGRAQVLHDTFALDLQSRPPDEAMNSYGLGVGTLVIAPRTLGLPDGRLSKADKEGFADLSGGADRHAIIYVDHDQADAAIAQRAGSDPPTQEDIDRAHDHWLYDFPPGYSCGEARDAPDDETFDFFVPVDCDEFKVKLGPLEELDFPNWT